MARLKDFNSSMCKGLIEKDKVCGTLKSQKCTRIGKPNLTRPSYHKFIVETKVYGIPISCMITRNFHLLLFHQRSTPLSRKMGWWHTGVLISPFPNSCIFSFFKTLSHAFQAFFHYVYSQHVNPSTSMIYKINFMLHYVYFYHIQAQQH